jgi:polyphosphate kinase
MNLLIENEIRNAKEGKQAYIYLKLNNLTDSETINNLYEASAAGVNIKLIIRGMISLVPGLKDVSENIKAIGIVDRFLEHSRLMIFCNGGSEEYYISSADLMTRNIEHRIEVTCPVFDKNIRIELKEIFEILWHDNVKARKIDAELSNKFVKPCKTQLQAQIEMYNFLNKTKLKISEK